MSGTKAPRLCPVCRNPLLKGDAVAIAEPPPPPAHAVPLQQGEGAAVVNTDDTGPSETDPA